MALSQYNSMVPLNCDPYLGAKERCPHCGLFHLRPGYCWKLDLVNNPNGEPTIPVHKPRPVNKVESLPVHKPEPDIEPEEEVIDAAEKRKRYRREWMRKKREQEGGH